MSLAPGTRLGPYEILAPLGAGGMGEVYRARDPRLGREVAVKVLLQAYASDPERLRRFELEARASGALKHPNILVVLDIGTHDGAPYLVTEILEGESLRQRLRQGPLSARKALEYGAQIADGLAAAHEAGIVHRDVKPENLFVTKGGRIKMLDFGLAKLRRPSEDGGASDGASGSTATGAVVGTVSYMSPEQIRALPVDHRSDIFALGVVLYEMLAGQRPFRGETSAETMTAILKQDPEELSGSAGLSAPIDRIVRRCLEKEPADRFHSAHDLGLALEALAGQGMAEVRTPASSPRRAVARALLLGAVLVGVAAFAVARRVPRALPPPEFHRVTFRPGFIPRARFTPDGNSIVFRALWEEEHDLYLQRLDATDARPLGMPGVIMAGMGPGELAVITEDTDRILSRIPLEGGGPRRIVDHVWFADWSRDGKIAVSRAEEGREWIEYPVGRRIWEAPASGGIGGLRVSPDGRRVAFVEARSWETWMGIAVVDEAGRKATLSEGWRIKIGSIAWSPDGREVWFAAARPGSPLALHAVTLAGRERRVLAVGGDFWLSDISKDGRVLLTELDGRREVRGAPDGVHEQSLSWHTGTTLDGVSRDGTRLLLTEYDDASSAYATLLMRTLGERNPVLLGEGDGVGLSPDGAWALAVNRMPGGHSQLSLVPTGTGETVRLARGNLEDVGPAAWFPDGRRIVVNGNEPGRPGRVFVQEVPAGEPRPLTPEGTELALKSVSPDGQRVLVRAGGNAVPSHFALFPTGGGAAIPISGLGDDRPLAWSGDGRSLYVSPGTQTWGILRLDIQTGRSQPWKELHPPDKVAGSDLTNLYVAPDGVAYFYGYDFELGTLYVVDGLY